MFRNEMDNLYLFTASGVMHSFGLPFLHILDEFDEGNRYTSWILSVMSAMSLCAGISNIFQSDNKVISFCFEFQV